MSWPKAERDIAPQFDVPWIGTLRVRDRVKYRWDGEDHSGVVVDIDKHIPFRHGVMGDDSTIEIQLDTTGLHRTQLSKLIACNLRRCR